jgi:phage protein D
MPLLPPLFGVQVAFAPLPATFMQALRQIEIATAVGQASILRLHFDVSRTFIGDLDVLAFDVFQPMFPISIQLSSGLGLPQCLINGYINDAKLAASNQPGQSTLEVVAMDALGTVMSHVQTPLPWPNLPDSAIAASIFTKHAIRSVILPTPLTRTERDTTTIHRGYDAAFLMQLARRNHYEVYLQPDPLTGRDVGHFHPPLISAPPQGTLSVDFGTETNLRAFHVSNNMLRPTSVVTASSDPHTRARATLRAGASLDPPMGQQQTLARILVPPVKRLYGTGAANLAEAQRQAEAHATISSRTVQASGEVDGLKYSRPLLPGQPVQVRGPGGQHSGLYYVTSVAHQISRDDYVQSFSAWRNAVGLTGMEIFADARAPVA